VEVGKELLALHVELAGGLGVLVDSMTVMV